MNAQLAIMHLLSQLRPRQSRGDVHLAFLQLLSTPRAGLSAGSTTQPLPRRSSEPSTHGALPRARHNQERPPAAVGTYLVHHPRRALRRQWIGARLVSRAARFGPSWFSVTHESLLAGLGMVGKARGLRDHGTRSPLHSFPGTQPSRPLRRRYACVTSTTPISARMVHSSLPSASRAAWAGARR